MRYEFYDHLSQLENIGSLRIPVTLQGTESPERPNPRFDFFKNKRILQFIKIWLALLSQLVTWVALPNKFVAWLVLPGKLVRWVTLSGKLVAWAVLPGRLATWIDLPGKLVRWVALSVFSVRQGYEGADDQTYLFGEDEQAYAFPAPSAEFPADPSLQTEGDEATQYLVLSGRSSGQPQRVYASALSGQGIENRPPSQSRVRETGIGSLVLLCTLCSAEFLPSPFAPLPIKQEPQMAEKAFLQLCHTCPSCHQTACPCCWNNRLQRCLQCLQAAGQLTRLHMPSLEHITASLQFVCMSLGQFQLQALEMDQQNVTKSGVSRSMLEQTEEEDHASEHWLIRLASKLEHLLTAWVFLLLCAIVIMCALALCFEQCNTLFIYWLHVDFRREIAFYVQILQFFHA
ncbi:MAG TPA: hypothetical protein VFN23_21405 [Ktedonobacteraceae bacterium]|nr:hypothetical protein [Ktedonobacteraceae bacterium]